MAKRTRAPKRSKRSPRVGNLAPRNARRVKGGTVVGAAGAAGVSSAGLSGQGAMSTLQQQVNSAATTAVTQHNIASSIIKKATS